MLILPVLDLQAGRAVHAIRGSRGQYAPVQGVLGNGGDAVALAAAYRERLSCRACYIADLDAISGRAPQDDLLRQLGGLGLKLWIDAGVSTPGAAHRLLDLDATKIIIGSETLASLRHLETLASAVPSNQLVLSVDLLAGVLRAPAGITTPSELVAAAAHYGIHDIILLDLARVGAAAGPPLDLLHDLRGSFGSLRFYAGGGVRHAADLQALDQAGAAGALVATALHHGILTAGDLAPYQRRV